MGRKYTEVRAKRKKNNGAVRPELDSQSPSQEMQMLQSMLNGTPKVRPKEEGSNVSSDANERLTRLFQATSKYGGVTFILFGLVQFE